ncbi:OsmC family protein [Brevibacterium luteolum]|nr:OsmC family protein [Brevibacterium luteolum]
MTAQETTGGDAQRRVAVTRITENHYRARTASGAEIEFGRGEGLMTPVELLLAATAGCSAIDLDTVTTRRTEPERFDITATGEKIVEDDEASRLDDIRLHFDLAFPDDQAGRQSAKMVERLLKLSHDRYCTVSRTIENGAPVTMTSEVSPDIAAGSKDA